MQQIFSVSELTAAIKKTLEPRFPSLSVQGEISNFKEQSSGHLYFTLKDAQSQLSAVFFRSGAHLLSRPPKNGDKVILRGDLKVYEPQGKYQIQVRQLEYAGVGELLLKFHELKLKLEAKGMFDAKRKRPLPKLPKTIGVVTSPTGAVIQDIVHVLSRRFAGFHLILNPVKVQGEGAAAEIAAAIRQFNQHRLADVLIVGRGGGSLEDLWAFNEEIVAQAIFDSEIPVISAVGHETDIALSDYVADVRAPTLSAAAEMAMSEKAHQLTLLVHTARHLRQAMQTRIDKWSQKVDEVTQELDETISQRVKMQQLRLVALEKQCRALSPLSQIQTQKQKLYGLHKALQTSTRFLLHKRQKLQQLTAHLRSIDPRNLLTKGYCILFRENAPSAILSAKQLHLHDKILIQMHDGKIGATIHDL